METTIRRSITIFTLTMLLAGCGKAPDPAKSAPAAAAEGQAVMVDETPREPASVEETARLLDLRKFPTLAEPKFMGRPTLGGLSYEAKGDIKAAYEFQRKNLTDQGWKELPDKQAEAEYAQGFFTRDGFLVFVSVSKTGNMGLVYVSLFNHGNVRPGKQPAPADVKREYDIPSAAGYVTKDKVKVADLAEACRKLLVDNGWQPYGGNSHEDKISTSNSMKFKKNAVVLDVSVSTHENRPGETMIQYSTGLVSADLPAVANAKDLHYVDTEKSLKFETADPVDTVIGFYRDTLAKQGWKPTTETKDGAKAAAVYFHNPAKDLISLNVKRSGNVSSVRVRHETAAEIAEMDKRIEAEKERIAKERAKPKPTIALPIPEGAKAIERKKETVVNFKLPAGSGKTLADFYRKHFKAEAGWKEDKAKQNPMFGSIDFKKDDGKTLTVHYTDVGFGQECEVSVWSSDILQLPKEKAKE
jgi:hypothetical protein